MIKSALLISLLMLSANSCVVGAPPGFSSGDLWTVPLVAPLENGQFLVPVSIQGEGPYLFLVDPDAPESSINVSIANGLKLRPSRGTTAMRGDRPTEEDHIVRVGSVQVRKMTIGTLSVRRMEIRIHRDNSYWVGGRRVDGVLGRDIISDSLIYHFDRDQGMLYIATQGNLKVPENAKKLSFTQSYGTLRRYLAKMKINQKHGVTMHLDLGAPSSMLWPELSQKFKLPKIPAEFSLVDEYGSRRQVTTGNVAGLVGTKKVEANAIVMIPFADRRLEHEDLDGVIGQNFWSKYNVTVNWHQKKFWLQDRNRDLAANAAARLSRWGSDLDGCENPACTVVTMNVDNAPTSQAPGTVPANDPVAPTETMEAPPAAAPGSNPGNSNLPGFTAAPTALAIAVPAPVAAQYSLTIEREQLGLDFAYDVVVGAVDENGKSLALPTFLVSFQTGVKSISLPALSPTYADAAGFVVLDMTPVGTLGCQGAKCIYKQPVQW